MNFNHDLLAALLSTLENAGISCGAGVALRVQQIFMLQGIQSWDDLVRARHLIGPVVARSKEEQQRFQQAFGALVQQHVKTAAPPPPDMEQKREAINKKAWRIAIGSCIAVFVVAVGIYFFTSRETEQPYRIQINGPQQAFTGQSVSFLAVADTFHTWTQLTWDFGDGNRAAFTGDNSVANHVYTRAGSFPVIVTVWSDSAQVKDTLQIRVMLDTTCMVEPGFSVSNDEKPNINAEIRFTNTSAGKCITRYEWEFNDNTRAEKKPVTDTLPLVHRFTEQGTYDVTLKAFTADTFFEYTRQLIISDKNEIIPLAEFQPLQKSNETVTQLRHHRYGLTILLLVLLLLLPLLFILLRFYYRKKQLNRLFGKHYHPQQAATAPYAFKTESGDAGVRSDKTLSELAFRLRQPEKNDQLQFDIYDTIAHTIQHAGFPKIIFDEENLQPEYLVIADAGSGRNQQAELFKKLLETLGMYRVNMVVFYYSGSMEMLFSNTHPEGIPLSRVAVQYSRARLLVYSDGYNLLHEHTSDGFVTWAAKLFSTWKHRALLTPVPRYNWDEDERQLLQLFRVYPASLYGHLLMAGDFMRNKYQFVPRKNAVPALHPFTGNLRHYKKYISRPGDALLYRWLLALSVPEQVNWENTLLVGKAVEARYCGPNEQLLTFDNLLRITAIDWLQQGQLSPKHRAELYHELQQEPDAEALQRDINRELLVQTEKTDPPENSAAALSKKIQLALLRYQLRDKNAGTHEEQELHYLQQQGLLGRFANTEVVKETRGYTRFKPRRDFWVRMLGFSIMIAGAFFLFRNPLLTFTEKITGTKPKTVTVTDSLAYFNNRAAQHMNADPDASNVIYAARFLDSAKKYDTGKDDTLTYNMMLNAYRKGLYLYKDYKFQAAAKVLRDSTLTGYSGNAAGTLAQNLLHAEGVCCYYVSKDTIGFVRDNSSLQPENSSWTGDFKKSPFYAAFRRYRERAVELNKKLKASSFYITYPNGDENLEVLLKSSNADLQKEMYLLTVLPADASTNPLLSIKNAQGKELKSGYNNISLSLPGGTYRIKAKYAESTFDTLIRLTGNMKVLTRRESSEPDYYGFIGIYKPGVGDPPGLSFDITDLQTMNTIGFYTTNLSTGRFFVNTKGIGRYQFNVFNNSDAQNPKPSQSFIVKSSRINENNINLELGYKKDKLYCNTLTESPPGSGNYTRKPVVTNIIAENGTKKLVVLNLTVLMPNGKPAAKVQVFDEMHRSKPLGITDATGKLKSFYEVNDNEIQGTPDELSLTLSRNGLSTAVGGKLTDGAMNGEEQFVTLTFEDYRLYTIVFMPHDTNGIAIQSGRKYNRLVADQLSKLYPDKKFLPVDELNLSTITSQGNFPGNWKYENAAGRIDLIFHTVKNDNDMRVEFIVNDNDIMLKQGKILPRAAIRTNAKEFEYAVADALSPKHRINWQEQLKLQPWYKLR